MQRIALTYILKKYTLIDRNFIKGRCYHDLAIIEKYWKYDIAVQEYIGLEQTVVWRVKEFRSIKRAEKGVRAYAGTINMVILGRSRTG